MVASNGRCRDGSAPSDPTPPLSPRGKGSRSRRGSDTPIPCTRDRRSRSCSRAGSPRSWHLTGSRPDRCGTSECRESWRMLEALGRRGGRLDGRRRPPARRADRPGRRRGAEPHPARDIRVYPAVAASISATVNRTGPALVVTALSLHKFTPSFDARPPRYTGGTLPNTAPVRSCSPMCANRLIVAENACSLVCASEH
jgi:hypothetical protein